MASALAGLSFDYPPLFKAIAAESIKHIDSCNPQNLTNTVWAFSKLGYFHGPLFDAIASKAIPMLSEYKTGNLSNTAWAYAAIGYWHEPLLQAIAVEAIRRISELGPQDLANLSWAFDVFGRPASGREITSGALDRYTDADDLIAGVSHVELFNFLFCQGDSDKARTLCSGFEKKIEAPLLVAFARVAGSHDGGFMKQATQAMPEGQKKRVSERRI